MLNFEGSARQILNFSILHTKSYIFKILHVKF